ncbi:MAG TPA: glycosyltransferase family 2 protein [Chitinophagaceae bacterium]|nr:glycosyltransferase family 2 protein [Chitinophagaceae bacterium]
MQRISVVIVCKNEEREIGRSLESLRGLTDDIVVLDTGSKDATMEIVRKEGVRLFEENWEGFGKTKKKATVLAKYDWILNLDADEAIDEELKKSLLNASLNNESEVFLIKFKNFLGNKYLRFGEWGGDKHIRIFNRKKINWNEATVHERLLLIPETKITRLKGFILHHTVSSVAEYAEKTLKYGLLSAEKYSEEGKNSSWPKIYLAPVFTFLKYYIFKLGFLDGRAGFICARMTFRYTFIKYARLLELNRLKTIRKK